MIRSDNAPQTYKTPVTLTLLHKAMLDRFLQEGGMTSQSDVIRQALTEFYRKRFPSYVERETAAGQRKKKTLEEEEAFARITDEEYILEKMPGAILVTNNDGVPYVVFHVYGNTVDAMPVEGFKQRAVEDPLIEQFHAEGQARIALTKQISKLTRNRLEREYDIILPDFDETKETA